MALPALLVITPETAVTDGLREALRRKAVVTSAASLQSGLRQVSERKWSAILLSLDFATADMTVVQRVVQSGVPAASVLLASARPTMQLMVDASRLGLGGVLAAPLDVADVVRVVEGLLGPAEEVVPLCDEHADAGDAVIGASPAMLEVFRTVGRIAASPATVLLLGESGTGKEMIARAIHRVSGRSEKPFVAINCAAIPENLLESELFGHEKGAFTGAIARKIGRFERADGGTLLLDEIGDMSLSLQSKILRALQEREIERVGGEGRIPVDVRVIAATNKDLRVAISEGRFREDLYFRLAVVTLHLPRLVERGADLDLLIHHYVSRFSAFYGRPLTGIARSALDRLCAHEWPGNIRELKNVIERAVLMSSTDVLRLEHLPIEQMQSVAATDASPLPGYTVSLSMAEVERLHIREVLRAVGGHMGRASELLGLHRNTLTRKVRDYGLGGGSEPE
jgi:two-component system, NtrC family, response regulator AtoC